MKVYEWFYKPRQKSLIYHHWSTLKPIFNNIRLLQKNTSQRKIIRMKPKFVISNHLIAHEYASSISSSYKYR